VIIGGDFNGKASGSDVGNARNKEVTEELRAFINRQELIDPIQLRGDYCSITRPTFTRGVLRERLDYLFSTEVDWVINSWIDTTNGPNSDHNPVKN